MTDSSTLPIYDEVPYVDDPIRATHPAHLASIGHLFGVKTALPEKCKVLELGCAHGGNIVPLAVLYPESQFLGVDLSKGQIQRGRDIVTALGISNCTLKHASILDITADWGIFDFIICHGIFSWVPPEVRSGILNVFSRNLAENGIAYLSYNAFPGWHTRLTIREMMLLDTAHLTEPAERAKAARACAERLKAMVNDLATPAAIALREELPQMLAMPDWYYTHDFLSEYNQPYYLLDVVHSAQTRGLRYLGDSELPMMVPTHLPEPVRKIIREAGDNPLMREHYMDFARHRMFRRTLFCREGIPCERSLLLDGVSHAFFSSPLTQVKEQKESSHPLYSFQHPNSGRIDTADSSFAKTLQLLGTEWPRWVSFDELLAASQRDAPSASAQTLTGHLVQCIYGNLVEISLFPPPVATAGDNNFSVWSYARHQLTTSPRITNLRHEMVELDPVEARVALLLDGTRDLSRAVAELETSLPPIMKESILRGPRGIERVVQKLSKKALLTY